VLTWYPWLLGYLEIIGNYYVNSFLLTSHSFMKHFLTSNGHVNGGHMLKVRNLDRPSSVKHGILYNVVCRNYV